MLPLFPVCNASTLKFGDIPAEKLQIHVAESSPDTTEWIKPDEEAYKNERLRVYQGMLREKGITDPKALRLLTAQLYQENGALTEDRLGDHGCSFGLIQYNACAHHGMKALRFLAEHPEWKDWKYQMERMVEMVQDRFQTYGNNLRLVILAHNCPACARVGEDNGYYARISKTAESFTSL